MGPERKIGERGLIARRERSSPGLVLTVIGNGGRNKEGRKERRRVGFKVGGVLTVSVEPQLYRHRAGNYWEDWHWGFPTTNELEYRNYGATRGPCEWRSRLPMYTKAIPVSSSTWIYPTPVSYLKALRVPIV
jgi:hypothetical protein